jgi:cyclopropane fatty-acyl-phospholipid synthase-like methyltransferase
MSSNVFQMLNDSTAVVLKDDDEQSNVSTVTEDENIGPKLAPFNPTSNEAIQIALDLLELKDDDVLYDLGCGDGRLLIEVIMNLYYSNLYYQ